ncbi:50S ribosomal protein L24 [Candidatus Pacearchaeota archaeon]|nr:50S ribosomal protein L24 [Candidatus Pacearchaeota archaeon]
MKKKFSLKWKASRQIRKQIKYRHNAPLHIKRKFFSANLSKELRRKYSKRSFGLHKGDIVKIMRGEFAGKKGKITGIDTVNLKVYVEGVQKAKKDGTKLNIAFNPTKLQIVELNMDDKKRIKSLERKTKGENK